MSFLRECRPLLPNMPINTDVPAAGFRRPMVRRLTLHCLLRVNSTTSTHAKAVIWPDAGRVTALKREADLQGSFIAMAALGGSSH